MGSASDALSLTKRPRRQIVSKRPAAATLASDPDDVKEADAHGAVEPQPKKRARAKAKAAAPRADPSEGPLEIKEPTDDDNGVSAQILKRRPAAAARASKSKARSKAEANWVPLESKTSNLPLILGRLLDCAVGPRYKIEVGSWRGPSCSSCLLDVLAHPGEGTLGCCVRVGRRRISCS
eukprot:3695640-Pyramimonas_sp.AAC.1